MGNEGIWGWYPEDNKWVKVRVDDDGSFHVVGYIDKLNDIGDVNAAAPGDDEVLYWDDAAGKWQSKAVAIGAHKDSHDPEDGTDPLDTAIPVKVGVANAIGNSHSLARADHVHEREHAIYTDAAAKAAAVQAGAITNGVTKAPTHDAVYDMKVMLEEHSARHEAGGDDVINVAGLSGVLADPQTPIGHHTLHELGNADAIVNPLNAGALPALTTGKIWKGVGDRPAEADPYTDAKAVDAIEADDNLPVASITFIIDGGGSVITTGIKGALEIPFACTINRVTLLADQSGSIVIDIWKQAYADYPPENANSITSAAPPTLSTAVMSQDSTLTDWTTAIAAGDCLMFNVDSIATCTWVTLSLKVTKT